jgi:hypothetical protein
MNLIIFILFSGRHFYHQEKSISDIIFVNYLPVILSGIISFSAAYYIFYKGRKQKEDEEEKRLEDVKEYLHQSLLFFYYAIISQLKSNSKYLTALINNSKENNYKICIEQYTVDVGMIPIQLETVNKSDSFKILVQNASNDNKKEIIKNYFLLFSGFQMIKEIYENMLKDNSDTASDYSKIFDKIISFKIKIDEIIGFNIQNASQKIDKQDENLYFLELMNIQVNYIKKEDYSIDSIVNDFVNPIFKQSIDSKHLSITHNILMLCKEINNEYLKLKDMQRIKVDNFKHWNRYLLMILKYLRNTFNLCYGIDHSQINIITRNYFKK